VATFRVRVSVSVSVRVSVRCSSANHGRTKAPAGRPPPDDSTIQSSMKLISLLVVVWQNPAVAWWFGRIQNTVKHEADQPSHGGVAESIVQHAPMVNQWPDQSSVTSDGCDVHRCCFSHPSCLLLRRMSCRVRAVNGWDGLGF
jgi:hypothetical protein